MSIHRAKLTPIPDQTKQKILCVSITPAGTPSSRGYSLLARNSLANGDGEFLERESARFSTARVSSRVLTEIDDRRESANQPDAEYSRARHMELDYNDIDSHISGPRLLVTRRLLKLNQPFLYVSCERVTTRGFAKIGRNTSWRE